MGVRPVAKGVAVAAAPVAATVDAQSRSVAIRPAPVRRGVPVGEILRGWRDAWRGRRENPLAQAWALADARRSASKPWHRRNPGLAWIAGLMAVAGLALESFALTSSSINTDMWDDLSYRLLYDWAESPAAAIYGVLVSFADANNDDWLVTQLTLLFILGIAGGSVWLLARLYAALVFCFGLLEREAKQRVRHNIDDILATAPLTEQEVVVGGLSYVLRKVWRPVVLLSASVAGFASTGAFRTLAESGVPGDGLRYWAYHDSSLAGSYSWATIELFFPLISYWLLGSLILAVGGLAVCASLLLAAIALGNTPRAGVWPQVGALSLVAAQPLGVWMHWQVADFGWQGNAYRGESPFGSDPPVVFSFALIGLLHGGLLFYLSRRLAWLRVALTAALPGMLLLPILVLPLPFAVPILELGSVLNPRILGLLLEVWGKDIYQTPGIWDRVGQAAGWALLMLPLQLGLLVVCAEFARDAVRRRKWGAA